MIAEKKTYHRRYTTAPKEYDYSYTRELDANAGWVAKRHIPDPDKPVRLIEIEAGRVEAQSARNGSGLHPTWTPEQFEEQVEAGFAGRPH